MILKDIERYAQIISELTAEHKKEISDLYSKINDLEISRIRLSDKVLELEARLNEYEQEEEGYSSSY